MHFQLVSLLHCRSLRSLYLNNLTGTIPPQFGNLSQLTYLYTQIRIALHLTLCITSDLTLFANNLLFDTSCNNV